MPFDNRPIGVFDSGIGGLSVARLIARQLPEEDIVYIGDTAHLPYGNKSADDLIGLARNIMDFLAEHQVKAIVAACNTSSSVSIDILRNRYSVPIIGVVKPGARAAAWVSRNRRIGILATAATAKSSAYRREILALDRKALVWEIPCPELAPMVEAGLTSGPEVKRALSLYLQEPLQNQVDTIVLGCTHYPYLIPVITDLAGEGASIVDPALETVNELKRYLTTSGGCAAGQSGKAVFFATGPTDSFYNVGTRFWGRDMGPVEVVKL